MSLELESLNIPDQTEVKIEVSLSAKVNVTNFVAQQKVSRLLLEQVGNLLYGEKASLVVNDRLLWRVPVWLGLPDCGPVGQVGHLDVDAQTGHINYTQETLSEIADRADALATRSTPTTTP